MRPDLGLGDLRRLHREGRRADFPGGRQRRPMEGAVRNGLRFRRPAGRSPPENQQRPGRGARLDARDPRSRLGGFSAAELSAIFEANAAVRADHPARGPVPRSPPAATNRRAGAARAARRPNHRGAALPLTLGGRRPGVRSIRPSWGSTARSCWRRWVRPARDRGTFTAGREDHAYRIG